MHAKPDLRVLLKWMIAGSGSVIADVIRLKLEVSPLNAAFKTKPVDCCLRDARLCGALLPNLLRVRSERR